MNVSDLVFESNSCCGTCFAATVDLGNGQTLGVVRREDGLYNLSFYDAAGLVKRESAQTADQVNALLP